MGFLPPSSPLIRLGSAVRHNVSITIWDGRPTRSGNSVVFDTLNRLRCSLHSILPSLSSPYSTNGNFFPLQSSFSILSKTTMSFALSAQETRVDDGHILRARLQREDGEWVDAEIDLNDFVGNNEGM